MSIFKKTHYRNEDIIPFGNMFIIGNGHIGYRGTLEEEGKDDLVGLNLVGTYDKYLDKWRESLNLPNPFHIRCYIDEKLVSTEANKPINHEMNLDLKHAIFKRKTIFKDCIITSERFIPFKEG